MMHVAVSSFIDCINTNIVFTNMHSYNSKCQRGFANSKLNVTSTVFKNNFNTVSKI